jgi:phosphinothricin acetyltransferase
MTTKIIKKNIPVTPNAVFFIENYFYLCGTFIMKQKKMKIRFATPEDAAQLLKIYAYYVENTAITFEWTIPSVEDFAKRIEKTQTFYPYIVAEEDGLIKGYAYASRFRERKAYDWCIETSIYIDKDCRRNNLGTLLLSELERILSLQGILNVNASITTSCDPDDKYVTDASRRFHEKHGYRFVGEFQNCGFKFNRWYNMMWMEKFIGKHTENQPSIKSINEIAVSF